jgi:hypothetical protein
MSVTPPFHDPISSLNLSDTFYTWYRRTNDVVQKLNPLEIYGITASTEAGFDGLTIDIHEATGIATIGYVLPYTIPNDHDFTGGLTFSGDIIAVGGSTFEGNVQFDPNDTNGFVHFNTGNVQFESGVNKVEFFTALINIDGSQVSDPFITISDSNIETENTDISVDLKSGKSVVIGDTSTSPSATDPAFESKVPSAFYTNVWFASKALGYGVYPTVEFESDVTINALSESVKFTSLAGSRSLVFDSNSATFSGGPNVTWSYTNSGGVEFANAATLTVKSDTTFTEDGSVTLKGDVTLIGKVYDTQVENPGSGYVLITDPNGTLRYGNKQYIWNTDDAGLGTRRFAMNYWIANMAFIAGRAAQGLGLVLPRYYVFSRRSLLPTNYNSSEFHGASHGGITFHPGYYSLVRAYSDSAVSGHTNEDGTPAPLFFGGTMSSDHARIYACGGYKTFGLPYPEMGPTFSGLTGCSDQRMKDKYWWADINIYEGMTDPLLEYAGTTGGVHYSRFPATEKKYWTSNMRVLPTHYGNNVSEDWGDVSAGASLGVGVPVVPGTKWLAGYPQDNEVYWSNNHRQYGSPYTTSAPEIVYEDLVDLVGSESIGLFGGKISKHDTLRLSESPYMWNVTFKYSIPAGTRFIIGLQLQPTQQRQWNDHPWDAYPYNRGGTGEPGYDDYEGKARRVIQVPSHITRAETFGSDETSEIQRMLRVKSSDWIKRIWKLAHKAATAQNSGWRYRDEWADTATTDGSTIGHIVDNQETDDRTFTKADFTDSGLPMTDINTINYGDWSSAKMQSVLVDGISHAREWIKQQHPNLSFSYFDGDSTAERMADFHDKWDAWFGENDGSEGIPMHLWNEMWHRLCVDEGIQADLHFGAYGVTGCGRDLDGFLYGARDPAPDDYEPSGDAYSWGSRNHGENESRLYSHGPFGVPLDTPNLSGPDLGYYDRVIRPQRIREWQRGGKRYGELERQLSLMGSVFRDATPPYNHEVMSGWGYNARVVWYPNLSYTDGYMAGPTFSTSFIDPATGVTSSGVFDDGGIEIIPSERCHFWSDNREMMPWWMSYSKAAYDYYGQLPAVTGDIYGTHTMGGAGVTNSNKHDVELRAFFNDNNNPIFSPFKNEQDGDWIRWKKSGGTETLPSYERLSTWGSGYVYHSPSISDQILDQFNSSNLEGYQSEFELEDYRGNIYKADGFHKGAVYTKNPRVYEDRSRFTTIDLDFTDIEPEVYSETTQRINKTNPQTGYITLQIPAPVGGLSSNTDGIQDPYDVSEHELYLKTKILTMDIREDWKSTPKEIWEDTYDMYYDKSPDFVVYDFDGSQIHATNLRDYGEQRDGNDDVDDHKIYAGSYRESVQLLATRITIQR